MGISTCKFEKKKLIWKMKLILKFCFRFTPVCLKILPVCLLFPPLYKFGLAHSTIRTQATFLDFVDTFCFKLSFFDLFSEIRGHKLSGVPYCNNSKCAAKYSSWRIEWWVKRRNRTTWSRPHRVWNCRVDKKKWVFVNFFADFKLNFWWTSTN